jgi:hypothetical protein
MTGWREVARRLKEQEGARDEGGRQDAPPPGPGFVPIVPSPVSLATCLGIPRDQPKQEVQAATPSILASYGIRPNRREAQRMLDAWCASFNALKPRRPAPGIEMGRWQTLFDCGYWWLQNFGAQAARDGWQTGDVFGIRAGYPMQGGLVDQLGDCRSLLMSDGGARWRTWGSARTWAAGCCPHLAPFWAGGAGQPAQN